MIIYSENVILDIGLFLFVIINGTQLPHIISTNWNSINHMWLIVVNHGVIHYIKCYHISNAMFYLLTCILLNPYSINNTEIFYDATFINLHVISSRHPVDILLKIRIINFILQRMLQIYLNISKKYICQLRFKISTFKSERQEVRFSLYNVAK